MSRSLLRPAHQLWHRSKQGRPSRSIRRLASATKERFGQPLHETHPHLIASGELTPGISALEYHYRRANLAAKLPKNSVAILAANDVQYRSASVFYEHRQEPNFLYLTGFLEPDALAVIGRFVFLKIDSIVSANALLPEKGQSDVEYTFHLFVRPKDERAESWEGARSGVQAAKDVFNADEAYSVESVRSSLTDLIKSTKDVYTDIGMSRPHGTLERFILGTGTKIEGMQAALKDHTVKPLRQIMNELRVQKSAAELDNMRRAGSISGAVITEAMKIRQSSEKQLWADLTYGFKSQGLDGEAYVPVIAGGQNGLSIHYIRNDEPLKENETVLVDAGGAYGGYITDITRCWPVNGKWTAPQKDLYNMVLKAQIQLVEMCRENASMTLDSLHRATEVLLSQGLKDLGFNMRYNALEKLFPHHVGHYIGLDVHDAPGFSRSAKLLEGQCITIEPGIYVPDEDQYPEAFRGLAVRIEDSVVIGKEKAEVLTSSAVKDADVIESLQQ